METFLRIWDAFLYEGSKVNYVYFELCSPVFKQYTFFCGERERERERERELS